MMMLLLAFMGVAKAEVVTIGDGTGTTYYAPFNSLWGYSFVEQVYTANEIGTAGTISAISFNMQSTDALTNQVDVFMKNVTRTNFSDNTDWEPVTASDMVFSGTVTFNNGWTTITLDTPFEYDGTSNLMIGMHEYTSGYSTRYFYYTSVTGGLISGHSDSANPDPYNMGSFSGTTYVQNYRANIQITIAGEGGGSMEDMLHVKYMDGENEVIDTLNMGVRPAGAWMEPFTFTMYSEGPNYTVNVLDFTPSDGMFTVEGEELPFQVAPNADVELTLACNGTEAGVIERQFVAITEGNRAAHIWPVMVELYTPECPDVVEVAYDLGTIDAGYTYEGIPSEITPTVLHNDYTLPFPEIPEGEDAVYKFTVDNDVIISAWVDSTAENGKVALYTEDFYGEGGPMATNNYTGLSAAGGGSAAAPFEAQIGEGTSTSGYLPFYSFYNYSISQQLFLAAELEEAGVTRAPMTSLSWYCTATNGNLQSNITIWMANVEETAIGGNSIMTGGMTKVYTGNMTPTVGWDEFVFNEGTFAWDGHSNILISVQRNNGAWASGISWQCGTQSFTASGYSYNDSQGAYNMETNSYVFGTSGSSYGGTTTTRSNIIMKGGNRGDRAGRDVVEIGAGPVITDLGLTAGTYYLVASATQADYTVYINMDEMPCPAIEAEGFAFSPEPADDADEIEPASVTLRWMVPEYATGWRLVFGSTYYPDPNHPQTIMYPEDGSFSTDMANSYTVRNLWNNTNYFWHVEFNNTACPEGVSSPIWGFTTHLNVPQNLTAVDETVFDDEQIVLNWTAVVDRTYRFYNVYRDGELIGNTQVNNISNTTFTDGPLEYNMEGYTYYVTAVYDEGESAPSNTVNVKVSGYGDVNGHVYEQDGTTGIAGATVTMVGQDEFGVNHTYNFLTNAQGYYTGHIYAGAAYDGQAAKDGYQTAYEPVQGEPIVINYDQTTSPIDYILDENFDPVCQVIAEYYPDSLDPNSPYVKVYWGCGLPGSEIIEDFETGDFSLFDWQVDPAYPWTVTTTNPYEGTYCMKSGGAGVPSVVSDMTVTVDIPADGIMSYYGKISCESNWDYGYFYIDGVQKAQYTGVSNWAEKHFDITAGTHTFKWSYTKDASVNSNDDCFYVDYICFYKQPEPPQPAQPGWHTYAEGDFNNAVGSNVGTSRWAYEYPVSVLGGYAGFNMTKVSLFSDNQYSAVGGNYTCTIYQGGNEPMEGTAVSTITVDVPANQNAWVDFDLTTPVSITGSDKLWVVWTANSTVSSWPAGCTDVSLIEEGTWWSAGIEAGYGWEHETYGTWTMRQYFTNRAGEGFYSYASENAPVAVEAPVVAKGAPVMPEKGKEIVTTVCADPTPAPVARYANGNRSLNHYRVYRTNCYNDGPYTEENTVLLATVWVPDTVYIDVEWADLEPGVYKWGVGAVYEGNRGEMIEGEISWTEPVSVRGNRDLAYDFDDNTMQGWTSIDADGDGNGWVSSSNPGIYHNSGVNLSGTGHNSSEAYVISGSYANQTGQALYPDNYLVSPQIALGGSITFYACAQDATYAAEHFGVAVSTTNNTSASAFTTIQEWTMTAKGAGMVSAGREGNNRAQGNWYEYTVDLSSYSGMGYVAIRHFNCSDEFILNVDDITIVEGAGGPTPPTPPTPGSNELQLPRESEIVWSNCLDKDMFIIGENQDGVTVNVLLNSADSPEGVQVTFTNYNEAEQEMYPVAPIELDETGFYAYESFRKGEYNVKVELDGYEPIEDSVSIWEPTDLRYVMTEIIYGVSDLYVSSTGWAMWGAEGLAPTPGPTPGPGGNGDTFSVDFEAGMPAGWTTIDGGNPTGYGWQLASNKIGTGYGHNGSTDCVLSQSYDNNYGVVYPDNYLVSPQVTLAAGSTFSFWACGQDASYAAEHFGVFVSDNGTSNWTMVNEWTIGQKGERYSGPRGQRDQSAWTLYSVDLSNFAGQKYVAIRHFNCYDMFYLDVDDIELSNGAKDGDRHLEYFKVMCTSIDGEPIFNADTEHPFCQVNTESLVAGEHYIAKVAAVYSTGMSAWSECEWQYIPCDNYAGTLNGIAIEGNTVSWDYPNGSGPGPQPGPGSTFSENCDAGMPAGWTTVDADGDGYTWVSSMTPGNYHNAGVDLTGTGHNASAHYVISGSWANGTGQVLYPDNYLVSPQVTLAAGSTFSFWACAQDASYPADHFGVFISDNGTSNWTMVNEWTMTAKGNGAMSYGRDGANRAQGNWYNYSVDLSNFAGQKYIAIRHFNCSDQFILNVDDLELTSGAKSRDTEVFFNGFVTDPGAMANGADASWIKGSQSTWGPNVNNASGYWLADSFTLSAATTISEIEVYGYQTGSSTTSTFTGLYAQIYNGNPMSGGSVVWGSATSNIMTATAFTNCYRGSDGETTATTRPIMSITADNLNIELEAGTYYLAYSLTGSGTSGPWGAPHCEPVIGNTGNGVQNTGSAWQVLTDSGDGTTYGCAMKIMGNGGTPGPGPQPGGDVLGAMIFVDGEWEAFVEAPTNTYTYEGEGNEVCVRMVYNGTNTLPEGNIYYSMSCPECVEPNPGCAPGEPIHAEVDNTTDEVTVWWGEQPTPPAQPIEEWLYYDDGANVDAIGLTTGGSFYWGIKFPAASLSQYVDCSVTKIAYFDYSAHTGTVRIYNGSNGNGPGTLIGTYNYTANGTEDWAEWTIPAVAFDNTQDLWIVMNNASGQYVASLGNYTGDPNGTMISTDGSTWYTLSDATGGSLTGTWNLRCFVSNQAKGEVAVLDEKGNGTPNGVFANAGVAKVGGSAPMNPVRAAMVQYNVYRSTDNETYEMIGSVPYVEGQTYYEYVDAPGAGSYYYQVRALYDNDCESEPAPAFDDPTHDYVTASVDAVNENSDNVALYPNPTKGNVTIEAAGMSRITVVSVLGQVVYDTEVSEDTYVMNMSQFTAGMYMVRVYTESGVTVKRVTVMQ